MTNNDQPRRCTKCGDMRQPWEYGYQDGRRRAQCRQCMNAMHKDQPSTTQGIRDGRAVIEARLGAVPGGCVTPPTSVGKPPRVCPWLKECRKRERNGAALLMCEVDDVALNIPPVRATDTPDKGDDMAIWLDTVMTFNARAMQQRFDND